MGGGRVCIYMHMYISLSLWINLLGFFCFS